MKRAWFTSLDVSKKAEENSWRDEQRFMYLRLRRLVGSVNEHLFENLHYEHELLLQVTFTCTTKIKQYIYKQFPSATLLIHYNIILIDSWSIS